MAVAPASLALNDELTATTVGAAETLYTSSNVITQIDAVTVTNAHGSAVDVSLYILASGEAATAADPIIKSIPAGGQAIISELIGHKIPKGGTIQGFAGTTNVLRVTASGVQFI